MANIYSLQSLAGASLLSLDDSGNLTVAGSVTSAGAATGITNLTATGNTALGDAAADTVTVTGHMDIDSARTTAGSGLDIDGTINSASAAFSGLDITAVQLTTARTSGTLNGAKLATTSLAGDLNSVVYADLRCAAPTDGGGTVVHAAIVVEAGHDVALDLSACATGEADIVLGDNLAAALVIREGANDYLTVVTTNAAERVTLGKRLGLPTQAAIAMADADVTLTTSTLTGQVLLASCTTGAHNLTMPSPTTYGGFLAFFYNTGSQSIVLKDDGAATMATVTAGSKAIITCNGTNWVAGLLS
jgi:hypothetical protein